MYEYIRLQVYMCFCATAAMLVKFKTYDSALSTPIPCIQDKTETTKQRKQRTTINAYTLYPGYLAKGSQAAGSPSRRVGRTPFYVCVCAFSCHNYT